MNARPDQNLAGTVPASRRARRTPLNRFPRTPRARRTLALIALLGAAALGIRAFMPDPKLASPLHDIPPLEYFGSAQSFSEIEQARSHLQALSRRYLYAAQIHLVDALQAHWAVGGASPADTAPAGRQARQRLEEGIRDLRGTPEEAVLTHPLLMLLAQEGAYDRWLQLYLDLLYRQPTVETVGLLAEAALTAGHATGRRDEVLAALQHVSRIPLDFAGKHRVRAALAGAPLLQLSLRLSPSEPLATPN